MLHKLPKHLVDIVLWFMIGLLSFCRQFPIRTNVVCRASSFMSKRKMTKIGEYTGMVVVT